MDLDAVVVVPARDEEAWIGSCLGALAAQTLPRERFEVIVVLDACTDATGALARRGARELGLCLRTLPGPGRGAGAARVAGMETAARELLAGGRPDGLIACTDADTRPAPDWLERQLAHVERGAEAIAGLIELDLEPGLEPPLPPGVLSRRERDAAARLARVRRSDPLAGHHHFAGASLAVTARTYERVGGLDPLPALEDAAFARRLETHGVAILRPADVRVRTSPRVTGRVARGLSVDLAVSSWAERRRFRAADFPSELLAERKGETTIAVVIPTKECRRTIASVLRETVRPLNGLVDELVVVDAGSTDGTAEVAAGAGARVLQQDEILPEHGPALGKGDAMWRAVAATSSELVCFLDGDTGNPGPLHLLGLLGPLLCEDSIQLVKGAFDRPLRTGAVEMPHEGGRVTELMARPLLNVHEPRLAGFAQPLAGEFAARRELLEAISFPVGYGIEIAVLIDALRRHGLDALAECHIGTRHNRHQPLRALGEMAYAVLAAMENRLEGRGSVAGGHYLRPWDDGAVVTVPVAERPPLRSLTPSRSSAPA